MARKQYPLRIDPQIWEAVERWAQDEMRSSNGQVEWIIRDALRRAGRLPDVAPAHTNRRAAPVTPQDASETVTPAPTSEDAHESVTRATGVGGEDGVERPGGSGARA